MEVRRPGRGSPSSTAWRKSSASAPSATRAPIATIATGSLVSSGGGARAGRAGAAAERGGEAPAGPSQASTIRCALVPPKPNALTARAPRPRPVFRLGQQAQRGAVQLPDRVIRAQRGGAHPGPHRAEHLEQPGASRDGQQVADVGLDRADREIRARREDPARAACLYAVSHRSPGGVAFEQRNGLGRHPGRLVGQPHRTGLPVLGRSEQAAVLAVVGQPDGPDHPEDGCARPGSRHRAA